MENFKEKFDSILIDKLNVEAEDLFFDAKFTEDFGADSLDMVELTMEFESEFNVKIPDDDVGKIATVGDAESYLREKLVN